MAGFLLLVGLFILFLLILAAESIILNKNIRRIPLRISVSGTRGKTSIVRTLASVLQAHGIRVLAKTTGSEAMYVLPDGSEEKINRRGLVTILEQKRLITRAMKVDADCIVVEIMSIHPDNHRVETQKLIKPTLTILANFRADHTDVVGESVREISGLFENDLFPGSCIIIPEGEWNAFIGEGIRKKGAVLLVAPDGICDELKLPESVHLKHIRTNLDAVTAAARYLNIPDETICRGIIETRLDIGQLEISRFFSDDKKAWFVNSFAANDPVSTREIIAKTMDILAPEMAEKPRIIGLLSLRSDRGERSRQWLDFLQGDGKELFSRIFVSGIHSRIFIRKLENCVRLTGTDPEQVTQFILSTLPDDAIVFGIGNIKSLGEELSAYWTEGSRQAAVGSWQ